MLTKKHFIIIIVIVFVLVGLIFGLIMGGKFWLKKKLPEITPIPEQEKPKIINIPFHIKEDIKKEMEKIRCITGEVKKIKGKTLEIKAVDEAVKGKLYQVAVLATAKIKETKIDPITFIPQISDFSLGQIKIGDKIMVWAVEDDIRGMNEFTSEHLEVIVE